MPVAMNAMTALNYPTPVKLRVEDFDMLNAAGAFDCYQRTELIDGEIVAMNSQYRPHLFAKSRLGRRLGNALEALGSDLEAVIEGSIAMHPHDEPMPDIFLTRAPLADGAVPLETVALLVEVSDTTLRFDLGKKANVYARHAVPEYWVVDLKARVIRQFWQPVDGRYTAEQGADFDHEITSTTITGLTVSTHELG
jgi:Uma2 family endonuclease